ncbi:hypothetical protein [Arenibaculum pallidiluteum]|uniref:hypothetical protein n=1 Tax=Arenibaculum pallidiluteum TaxID=2812559 RepID=UPI001A96EA80|nr:hypothetical protein [Arenibaculum pallidiluteum]
MMPVFQRYVAIDWSGARGPGYRGVALAECRPGRDAPRLVPPDGTRWTRTAVAEWILRRLDDGPALIGFDMAFSLPFAKAGRHLARQGAGAFDLWAAVDEAAAGAPDFLGSPYVERHPGDFWISGARPDSYVEVRRATELACAAEGLGRPQSPYHLIGSKQVGRGALAGMRVLHHLRARSDGRIAFWPMQEPRPGATVCVEIYPRLFLRRAGHGNGKVRSSADLDRCLAALGAEAAGLGDRFDDHEADALVSAAGLRLLAGDSRVWRPRGLDAGDVRREGWIFGVGIGAGGGGGATGEKGAS